MLRRQRDDRETRFMADRFVPLTPPSKIVSAAFWKMASVGPLMELGAPSQIGA